MKLVNESTPRNTIVRCGKETFKLVRVDSCSRKQVLMNSVYSPDDSDWDGVDWDDMDNVYVVYEPPKVQNDEFVFNQDELFVTERNNYPVHIYDVFNMTENREVILGVYTNEHGHKHAMQWDMDGTCHNPALNLKRKTPPKKLAVDQPVWVRNYTDETWQPYHFAFVKDGKVNCWPDGKTSHTSWNNINHTNVFEFWTDENPY